jgi:hypothetical protein
MREHNGYTETFGEPAIVNLLDFAHTQHPEYA